MEEEAEELSVIDLIDYYEGGPVIRGKTPDVNRVQFGPDENTFSNKPSEPPPGKNNTAKSRLDYFRKKALGLLDTPAGSPPGAQNHRQRGYGGDQQPYDAADFEASNRSGFGGESLIDIDEDKPPVNIDRKTPEEPDEEWSFFDFLMQSLGCENLDLIKKEFYIADNGKIWMKKGSGLIYSSEFYDSNNILLTNIKNCLSNRQKKDLENRIFKDASISNAKKEVYREIIFGR